MDSAKLKASNQPSSRWLLRILISPSLISGVSCVLIGICVTGTILIQNYYDGSELQRQFFMWQQLAIEDSLFQAIAHQRYASLTNIFSSLQLFIFWYAVGLVIYSFGNAAYTALINIKHTKDSLGYANTNKRYIVRNAALQLSRQLGALFVWVLFTVLTVRIIIPYSLGTIHIANEYLPSIEAIFLLLLMPFILALCLHVHIVLIRLFLGRPRIWNSEEYSA